MKNFILTSIFKSFITALLVLLQVHFAIAQTASILPWGVTQFFDNNGNPLTSGTVDFYAPNTTTRQTTWQNSNETIVNTNPVILDVAGRAIIYGQGTYRQVLKDSNGNLIWDALTSGSGSSGGSVTNFGDGNAVGTVKMWAGIVAPAQYQFAFGQQLLRASFPDLFTAITQVSSVTCTSGSNILTAVIDTTQVPVGGKVEVSCVPGTSTVTAVTASTITVSNTANISTTVNATIFPFGNGNGSTTFTVPDLRGYTIAGRDNMGGTAANRLTSTYFGQSADALGSSGGTQSNTLTLAQMVGHTHTAVVNDPGHLHNIIYGTTSLGSTGTNAITSITSPGANVATTASAPTGISITNDSVGGGVSVSASLNQAGGIAQSTAIAVAGSGYTNGARVLTVSGGTCSTQPQFNVTVAGNAVTQLNSVAVAGSCTVYPANPAATTGGGGTGATLNVAFNGTNAVLAVLSNAGSGYTNGTQSVTILGGTCSVQPIANVIVASNIIAAVSSITTAGSCTLAPQNPVSLSGGGGTSGTLTIPFNPGGSAYTNGARIVTVQGGTCTTASQFNATVVNNQITTIGAQVTASNCSISPADPATIVDAGGVAASATLNVGGSGYTNGAQVLTVLGGTCSVQPSFNVTVVSGTVTAVNSLNNAGSCTINPVSPVATNGGGGIGATLNVTYTVVGSGATVNVIYGPQPFSNIQPTLTLNYVIKVLPDSSMSTTNVVTSINSQTGAFTCGANMTCVGNIINSTGGGLSNLTIGSTSISSGVSGRILYDNAGILGEATTTGIPNVLVFQTSPNLVTPFLDVATVTSINGLTITTTNGSLTIPSAVSFALSGANNLTLTTTGSTNVTLPTTGTLVSTTTTSLPNLATVGTLTSGATGAGFTLALGTSTLTGQIPVANGGTGLASGTSGGVPTYTASGTITSSAALTANKPVIGGGAGAVVTVGTVQNTNSNINFATMSGAFTTSHCLQIDANGNITDAGGACTTGGGGGTVTSALINQLAYYASAGTVVSGLATANNGVLITSGGGVPSISSTIPSATQLNITSLGTIATGVWNGTIVDLAHGGTNANLTASNGGIVYSNASALAILAGTVTANQCLLSGSSTTPSWGSCTSSLTVGTTSIVSGTTTRVLFDNAGALGEYVITGTGNVVMSASPTLTGTITGPAGTWSASGVNVAGGGTGITSGTSGGIPYFSSTSTIASSAALTANLPVIGGGAGASPSVGARTGNTTTFVTGTGSYTSGNCTKIDAGSNIIDFGSVCASLSATGQTLSGGANVTSFNIGTVSSGTTTISCGNSPLQYLSNNGAFTLAAPANDGSCIVLATNAAGAGAITFSGFTVSANTGDTLTTTSTNKFMISIVRINGNSNYVVRALQ